MTSTTAGIGDIASTKKGTAARYNSGKVPLDLIPLCLIGENALRTATHSQMTYALALVKLGRFQETGHMGYLHEVIELIGAPWEDCAAVFDYGRRKYAAWNWAKGMPWSAVIASCARHLMSLLHGEMVDPESTYPHKGHVMCNLVMLLTYRHTYPEGNDLPVSFLDSSR